MTTTLYGWTWVGTDEPTTGVQATQEWINPTTGDRNIRNTSNSAWIYAGNVNATYGGAVAKSGDTMTGALLGATNLPPIQDPDFQGTVEQAGFPLATLLALSQLRQDLKTYIDSTVRAQFLSQTKLSGTAANIAIFSDVLVYGSFETIPRTISVPLPTFNSDGVQATRGQVLAYFAAFSGIVGGATMYCNLTETSTGSMVYTLNYKDFGVNADIRITRFSIAVR